MVKRLLFFSFLGFFLVLPLIPAQELILDHTGTCKKFNLTLTAEELELGLYDLKIVVENRSKVGGKIYDPEEGWKSSFFYLMDSFEVSGNKTSITVRLSVNTTDNIMVAGKLRNGSDIFSSRKYMIVQNCPKPKKKEGKNVSPTPSLGLTYEGDCKEYNVTLIAENFENGTYDVKVSVKGGGMGRSAGQIYDPVEGWKSSYYYVDEALHIKNGSGKVAFKVAANTAENITLVGKLRKNSQTWQSDLYKVSQDCPEPEPMSTPLFLLIVLIAIVVLLVGITYYKKG